MNRLTTTTTGRRNRSANLANASKTSKVAESSPPLRPLTTGRRIAFGRLRVEGDSFSSRSIHLLLSRGPSSPHLSSFPRSPLHRPCTRLHHLLLLRFILFSSISSFLILPSSEHTATVYGDSRRYGCEEKLNLLSIARPATLFFSFPPFCPPCLYLSRPPVPAVPLSVSFTILLSHRFRINEFLRRIFRTDSLRRANCVLWSHGWIICVTLGFSFSGRQARIWITLKFQSPCILLYMFFSTCSSLQIKLKSAKYVSMKFSNKWTFEADFHA